MIVAVSGGPDSVCLLDVLNALKDALAIELVAAHFDHGLRPGEDEADTRFVKRLSDAYGLPLETGKASGLTSGAPSLEEKAREARYRFLTEAKARRRAQKIAVGHTLNDQAETVLMRLLRGSGPSGLSGIPPAREGGIVRPLIDSTRHEVLAHLESRGLSYRVDSSNFKPSHLRNRIRLELLPLLKGYQPRIVETLGHVADVMRADEEWFSREAEDWVKREGQGGDDGVINVRLDRFSSLSRPFKIRVVRALLTRAGGSLRRISRKHLEAVAALSSGERPQAELHLPRGLRVRKAYGLLSFSPAPKGEPSDFMVRLETTGLREVEEIGCAVLIEREGGPVDFKGRGQDPRTAFLDADKLSFPLVLRNFRPGDRMVPLGMEGRKKIKDLFIERKVPLEERRRVPILTHQGRPVWVCGLKIDDRYKVTPRTKSILKVSIFGKGFGDGTSSLAGAARGGRHDGSAA